MLQSNSASKVVVHFFTLPFMKYSTSCRPCAIDHLRCELDMNDLSLRANMVIIIVVFKNKRGGLTWIL
jgi:hypothetical protein